MMNKAFVVTLAVLTTRAVVAQEAPDTVRLREIVVTATRLPTARALIPASITVIEGDELRRRGIRAVDEVLRSVSGTAVVQSGSYGAFTSLFMRGGESDYVQVLVDGMQINSPGEQFNWGNLAIENIERIEIVKGPASVLYGSDAVAGVVQLITKQRRGPLRGLLSVSAGGGDKVGAQADGFFGNAALTAEAFGGTSRLVYSGGISHFASEGAYAFNNRHRNTSATGRASFWPDRQTQVSGSLRYTQNRFHFPTDGAGRLTDSNQFNDGEALVLGIDASRQVTSHVDARASFGHTQNDALTEDRPDDAADTLGFYRFHSEERFTRQTADLRVNVRIADASLVMVGTEIEWQSNRGSSASPFGDAAEQKETRNNRAAYAQWLGGFGAVSMLAGVRAEDNEQFGNFETYRGGLSAQLTRAIRVRASAGTGFKEPRFFEQFARGFIKGNPELEPERSRSIEVGTDLTGANARVTATYFAQRFKNLIQYVGVPATPDDPNYLNLAAARANGLEVETTWSLQSVTLSGSYTNLRTRVLDEGTGDDPLFSEGQSLIRRPRHSASLVVAAALQPLRLSLHANYVGKRDDLDFSEFPATRVGLAAYTRIDVAAEYRVATSASASLKIENAFDHSYEEARNFPARGRVSYLGARLEF